jgi:hypothetical protein
VHDEKGARSIFKYVLHGVRAVNSFFLSEFLIATDEVAMSKLFPEEDALTNFLSSFTFYVQLSYALSYKFKKAKLSDKELKE